VWYPLAQGTTELLSEHCDIRAVWGGDEKVKSLRAVPLPPRAVQIDFPDRYSYAAFSAAAYGALDHQDRRKLARRFFNDVYWFDQMGCASPRILFWIGNEALAKGCAFDFNKVLATTAKAQGYAIDAATAISKLAYVDRTVLDFPVAKAGEFEGVLSALMLESAVDLREHVMGAGTLAISILPDLDGLLPFLRPKDQTLSQFGFARAELEQFIVKSRGRGLDRIVNVGHALSFHHLWDGIDLIAAFSRLVYVE
jgi:hypothetical protein